MAETPLIVLGLFLLGLTALGYLVPVTDNGFTIPGVNNLCQSGLGQLGQLFSGDVQQTCNQYQLMLYGMYGLGIIGIILIIVGAVKPSISKKNVLTCPYCNFVPQSESELVKHKAENHLDKSPYKCEYCDFIGITEEVLWNHYNDKHPNEKKWK